MNTRRGSGQTVNGKRYCGRVCDIEIITARSLSPTRGGYENTILQGCAASTCGVRVWEFQRDRDRIVRRRKIDDGLPVRRRWIAYEVGARSLRPSVSDRRERYVNHVKRQVVRSR